MINIADNRDLTIYPISEGAVSVEFGEAIDESVMQQVNGFNKLLNEIPFPGMRQTVPAYTTLSVFYDPLVLIEGTLPGITCYEKVCRYLQQLMKGYELSIATVEDDLVNVPVCYGHPFGPDLDYVAVYHKLTADEVIRLHSSAVYKVYMIGFIPGFAYMGGLAAALETPRKATPAKAVPAGAVGIAGKQTGIYPLETPGGWQIIGQTPVQLFNAERQPPALLKAGDRVKFEPISLADFKKYRKG